MHLAFVGHEGCLPILLQEKNATNLPYDTILKIALDKRYSPDIDESGSDMMATDDIGTGEVRRRLSLVGYHDNNNEKNLKFGLTYRKWKKLGTIFKQFEARKLDFDNSTISNSNSTSNSNTTTPSIAPSPASMFDFGDFDYEFSPEIAILALPPKALHDHNFKSVNVTYSGSQCFGSWFTQFLLPLGGVDTVVINNVMHTMKKRGVLISKSGDYYTWSEKEFSKKFTSLSEFIGIIIMIIISLLNFFIIIIIGKKVGILLVSLMSFMFLSTTTALIVRILIGINYTNMNTNININTYRVWSSTTIPCVLGITYVRCTNH